MDELELLLSEWDDMDNKGKAIVLVIGLGAVAFALDQVLSFIVKWISPHISQNWMMSIFYIIPFKHLIIILFYTSITILLINRARFKAESDWAGLCDRLYGQIRKDHSGMANMVWDTNKEQKKLLFRNELDQLMYDAEYMLIDKNKKKS